MKNFDSVLLNYRDEFLSDLNELLSIRSISAEGTEIPAKALKWILAKAESFGLKTKNYDNIAGHAEYGEGEKLCGVLTHLDVVPANEREWSCEPFALTRKNGRLYGRGIADDKGSALAALYCLRALKECGVQGNRVRVIFGTSEEVGMEDMKHYFEHEPIPDMSFTPDSEYGICRAEKGILQLEISAPVSNNTTLTQLEAGKATNVVPDAAYALVDCTEEEDHRLQRLADSREGSFEIRYTIDGVMIVSKGKAAHACEPEKGFNAAAALVGLLSSTFGHDCVGNLCAFIDSSIGMETNGRSMGIKMRDSVSGSLSVTLSKLSIVENESKAVLDVRYPVTVKGEVVQYQITSVAKKEGLNVRVLHHQKPLSIDENAEIIGILKTAYKDVMGEEPQLYTTGGGTYARTLGGKGVAFGPVFQNDESNMHDNDESLDEENFFRHFRICLQAMNGMMLS
ncbi:MAG: Sapep family Mn(2+)-dependent dipeptidase [Lachnospiraceae bacterium]|nr:Sapep family Mn(2+)-dependent dipeptidase [Lachnospiraceae bacterium]